MSGTEPNRGPNTPTATGRHEGKGDDSAPNQPVLKEQLEEIKTLTQAVSRLQSAQIDSIAQMTAQPDATEGKLTTRLEKVADEQTALSHHVSALYEYLEQRRTSNENLQDYNEKPYSAVQFDEYILEVWLTPICHVQFDEYSLKFS